MNMQHRIFFGLAPSLILKKGLIPVRVTASALNDFPFEGITSMQLLNVRCLDKTFLGFESGPINCSPTLTSAILFVG